MSAILPPAPQGRAPGVWRHALSLAGPAFERMRVLRAQVYAIAAPPIAQVPATRSAAERRHRRDGGAPWHAPQLRTLARSRGPAPPGRGQAPTPRRGPTGYPALLCDHGHGMPTASAYGTGDGMPCLIPSRFFATVGIPRKSPLCRHTLTYFSAVFCDRSPRPLRPRAACAFWSGYPTSTAPAGGGT